MTLTLDEYRLQVFEKLRACTEAPHVRDILADVHTMLTSSCMSDSGQKGFWQSLNHDLNVLAHQLNWPQQDSGAAPLRAVTATAQAVIAQYQRQLKSDG